MFLAVATISPEVVGFAPLIILPAGTPEDNQKEWPESGYACCNYDSVALVAAKDPVNLVYRVVLHTHAFHIQSVTVITESCSLADYTVKTITGMADSQVMSARAFSSGSLEVLIHAHMQALKLQT